MRTLLIAKCHFRISFIFVNPYFDIFRGCELWQRFSTKFLTNIFNFFDILIFLGAVNMITKHFGSVAASTMKNMDMERLPLLVLIYKLRGSTEIFQVSNLSYLTIFKVSEQRG